MNPTMRQSLAVMWQTACRQDASMSRQYRDLGNRDKARVFALQAALAKRKVNQLTGR